MMRADLAERDWRAVVAFEAFVLAADAAGLVFDPRQTIEPKAALVVADPEAGKVGDVAAVSYAPTGAAMLELDFMLAAAPRNERALVRVEALLDEIAAVDERLASMVREIRERGHGNTHPNRPLAEQSPESMAELVRLIAGFNAGHR